MSIPRSAPLDKGHVVAHRYCVVRCIRVGGMGAVYEAIDRMTDRRRALKIMLGRVASDPDLNARFRAEATITGRVESDHVVEVTDAGVDEELNAPYLVMELLRGEDLQSLLVRAGKLAPRRAVEFLGQLAMGLDKTHAEGIVHRDLKPENVFVCETDEGAAKVKILDFGIAKVVAEMVDSPATTRNLGTPLYMAPEQVEGRGEIDNRADLYALGQLTYTMLTGHAYFEAEAARSANAFRVMRCVIDGVTQVPSARARSHGVVLPNAFDRWFLQATATDARKRFASAAEQVLALARVLQVEPPPLQKPALEAPSVPPLVVSDRTSTTVGVTAQAGGAKRIAQMGGVLVLGAALPLIIGLLSDGRRADPDRAPGEAAREDASAAVVAAVSTVEKAAAVESLPSEPPTASPPKRETPKRSLPKPSAPAVTHTAALPAPSVTVAPPAPAPTTPPSTPPEPEPYDPLDEL